MTTRRFIPGAHFHALTRSYDRLCRLVGLGKRLRAFEVAVAGRLDGKRVIEVGCGTGELLLALGRASRPERVVGLDPDPAMIAQAVEKLAAADVRTTFVLGGAEALPFPDASFDLVVSSLMLHHLDGATKRAALREWRRVLAAGGALVLVDFGVPRSRLLRVLLWPARLGLFEEVADNVRGRIPALLAEGGFSFAEAGRYRDGIVAYRATPLGATPEPARAAAASPPPAGGRTGE